jgi:RNA polymerase sigma factor (sigma-70 family)
MPTSPLKLVIQQLRTASERDGARRTDGELLTRFLSYRDNDALAALVHRHAPMVWGVCHRLLRSPHDAEDAFQATFLVLVRKAATVLPREMVGNWLYGVAHQTAVRLRATAAKRGVREMQMMEMPESVVAEARGDDLLLLLDQELSCLPEKYRVLIVLCDLESKTRIEVARQLAIPEGTVASRLARARGMLAKRLARHGLAVSGGSLAAALSQTVASASVPTSVVSSTIKVATLLAAGKAVGVISAKVAALTEGVVKAMLCSYLKAMVAVVLVIGFLASGATLLTYRAAAGQDEKKPTVEKPVEPAANQRNKKEKVTSWGKEVNGVQIGIQLGENRVYKVGETVTLILRLRNNGKNEVPFLDDAEYFQKNPPLITDANNKAVTIKNRSIFGFIKKGSVAPGKEVDLIHLELALRPVTDREKDVEWTLYGTGKFHIKYEDVPGVGEVRLGSPGMTLTTGRLELEVKEPEKPPQTGLPNPKVEKKKVYTPNEVMLEQEKARGKAIDGSKSNLVTVEFKVQSVTKPTEIKLTPEKDSPWAIGHSPDDLSLLPPSPKKFQEKQFTAILTPTVVKQLNRVGIQDVDKHFMGKTIRISGRINQHNYSGDDPWIEPHYDLVIEDVSQFETVD